MYDNKLNDAELVLLTLAGDETAYEILVSRHENSVKSAALSVTHNFAFADDAAQDAFVTGWLKLGCLKDPARFSSWITRIARNCAINLIRHWREYVDICDVENTVLCESHDMSPETKYIDSEQAGSVRHSVEKLPEKVRRTIHMYYFEDLSVKEIAKCCGVSESTVKWQLHDGRKKLRKDLSAMNENMNDSLVTKVMKKVNELMSWDYRAKKNGFEEVYSDVLADVELLPESDQKQHALSEVLMRGYKWITEQRNNGTLKKIREAALKGHNEEVMRYVAFEEYMNNYSEQYILEQLPFLRENGFTKAVTSQLCYLAMWHYIEDKKYEKAEQALREALETADKDDYYRLLIEECIKLTEDLKKLADTDESMFTLDANAVDLRITDPVVRLKAKYWFTSGHMYSMNLKNPLGHAALCEGMFYIPNQKCGDLYRPDDTSEFSLKCISKNESITVKAGSFDCCEVWECRSDSIRVRTYYADGTGIVMQEVDNGYKVHHYELISCTICGGSGLLPLCYGNTWEYSSDFASDQCKFTSTVRVGYADDKTACVSEYVKSIRESYNENSFTDMAEKIRNGYFIDNTVRDVSDAADRITMLASTPAEKAHAETMSSVIKTILATDEKLSPDRKESGHWNFFGISKPFAFEKKLHYNDQSSFFENNFELKNMDYSRRALLYGDVYGILEKAVGCIYDEEWKSDYCVTKRFFTYNFPITAEIKVEDAGVVEVKAGRFSSCLKISVDTKGYTGGFVYFGGKKEFIISPDFGLIKLSVFSVSLAPVVFELTEIDRITPAKKYGGMFYPGMRRRFELIDPFDGLKSNTLYLCESGESGELLLFSARLGTKIIPAKYTDYENTWTEKREQELWKNGERDKYNALHCLGNLRILLHFMNRIAYSNTPESAAAWSKQRLDIIKSLGENCEVPSAWLGKQCSLTFRLGCQLCGCGKNEEGLDKIEEFISLYEKWAEIPDGTLLSFGNELVYGDTKYPKNEDYLLLSDGTKLCDVNVSKWDLSYDLSTPIYGMTAEHGWEWFNGVRNEERYKELLERIRELKAKLKE